MKKGRRWHSLLLRRQLLEFNFERKCVLSPNGIFYKANSILVLLGRVETPGACPGFRAGWSGPLAQEGFLFGGGRLQCLRAGGGALLTFEKIFMFFIS